LKPGQILRFRNSIPDLGFRLKLAGREPISIWASMPLWRNRISLLSQSGIAFGLFLLFFCLFGAWSRPAQALDCTPTSATLTYEADDYFILYVNGNEISNGTAFDQGAPPATVTIPVGDFNPPGTPDYFAAEIINSATSEVGGDWLITINCTDGGTSYISDADLNLSFYDDLTGGSAPQPNGTTQWYEQSWVDTFGKFCCAPIATSGVSWWFTPLTNPLTGNPLPVLSHSTNGQDSSASEILYYRENVPMIDITPTVTLSPTITPTPYPPGCGPPSFVQAAIIGQGCIGSGPNFSFPYSFTAKPNALLVVRVEDSSSPNGGTLTNVKYGGNAMTLQSSASVTNMPSNPDYLLTYYLANPPTGPQSFTFTNSGGCSWNIAAELYQNVNEAAPLGPYSGTQFASSNSSDIDTISITTTGPASLVSDFMASDQANSSIPTSGAGQHSFGLSGEACCEGVYGDYDTVNGPGTYNLTYNVNQANRPYAAQPIEIQGQICSSPTNTPLIPPTSTSTSTAGPSPTVTMTLTPAPTNTPGPTALPPTPTPLPLLLHPLPPNPDPAGASGVYLPYWVQTPATVDIEVFTVSGEVVRNLDPFSAHAGNNEEFWDERNSSGNTVANGVFIIRIQATSLNGDVLSIFEKCSVLR
jgi:hypothetical protein